MSVVGSVEAMENVMLPVTVQHDLLGGRSGIVWEGISFYRVCTDFYRLDNPACH